jgi:hypothetical protein
MTAATLRVSTPAAAPKAKAPAPARKGFWTRLLASLIEAREKEVARKLGRFAKDGRLPYPYI